MASKVLLALVCNVIIAIEILCGLGSIENVSLCQAADFAIMRPTSNNLLSCCSQHGYELINICDSTVEVGTSHASQLGLQRSQGRHIAALSSCRHLWHTTRQYEQYGGDDVVVGWFVKAEGALAVLTRQLRVCRGNMAETKVL